MLEPSLEVSGGGFDDAGRGVPGVDQRVETVAVEVVDQGQLAQPGWADVDVVALCVFGGQPIELLEDLAVGEAVAQDHLRFAILGFFRGNPDTQFVLTGAHCLKLELNGIERDGKQVSLLFRCKEVPFLSNDRFAGYWAGNSLGKDYHNLLHI